MKTILPISSLLVAMCIFTGSLEAAQTLLSVTNKGGGTSIIYASNAPVPIFKGIVAGSGVTVTDGANITIAASGATAPTNTFDANQFAATGGTNIHIKSAALVTNLNAITPVGTVFVGSNVVADAAVVGGAVMGRLGGYWGTSPVNIGIGNSAGTFSFVGGVSAYADKFGVAIGYFAGDGTNSGSANIGIGYQATPGGSNSIAQGYQTVAGQDAVALGSGTTATFTNSVAIARLAATTAPNQIKLGTSGHGVEIPGSLNVTGAITNTTQTANTLTYANGTKVLSAVTIGAGLNLSNGTLSVTNSTNNAIYTAISTTFNTVLTNGTNVGFVQATIQQVASVTDNPRASLYIEDAGSSGTFLVASITGSGALTSLTTTNTIQGVVPPNSRYYFTNQGNTVTIVAGTAYIVNVTGGLAGGGGGSQVAPTNGVGTGVTLTNSTVWTSAIVDLAYGASNAVSSNLLVVTWNIATNNAAYLEITNHCLLLLTGFPPTNQLWTGTLEIQNASGYTLRTLGTNAWGTNGAAIIDWLSFMKTNGNNLANFASSKRTNGQAKMILQGF